MLARYAEYTEKPTKYRASAFIASAPESRWLEAGPKSTRSTLAPLLGQND